MHDTRHKVLFFLTRGCQQYATSWYCHFQGDIRQKASVQSPYNAMVNKVPKVERDGKDVTLTSRNQTVANRCKHQN